MKPVPMMSMYNQDVATTTSKMNYFRDTTSMEGVVWSFPSSVPPPTFRATPMTVAPRTMTVSAITSTSTSFHKMSTVPSSLSVTKEGESTTSSTKKVSSSSLSSSSSKRCAVQKKKTKKAPRWKRPADKPKRPASAYNLFFNLERQRLLRGDPKQLYQPQHVAETAIIQRLDKPKRLHVKTHGRIGFQDLSRTIAYEWKNLPPTERAIFDRQASIEHELYTKRLAIWKANNENQDHQDHQDHHNNHHNQDDDHLHPKGTISLTNHHPSSYCQANDHHYDEQHPYEQEEEEDDHDHENHCTNTSGTMATGITSLPSIMMTTERRVSYTGSEYDDSSPSSLSSTPSSSSSSSCYEGIVSDESSSFSGQVSMMDEDNSTDYLMDCSKISITPVLSLSRHDDEEQEDLLLGRSAEEISREVYEIMEQAQIPPIPPELLLVSSSSTPPLSATSLNHDDDDNDNDDDDVVVVVPITRNACMDETSIRSTISTTNCSNSSSTYHCSFKSKSYSMIVPDEPETVTVSSSSSCSTTSTTTTFTTNGNIGTIKIIETPKQYQSYVDNNNTSNNNNDYRYDEIVEMDLVGVSDDIFDQMASQVFFDDKDLTKLNNYLLGA